jgi:nucleotide-binding universal stress UspA family protein
MTRVPAADAPVLVGADGSGEGRAAVRWAADEARRLGVPLHVVHTWIWPLYHVNLGPPPGAPAAAGLQAQAEQILADAVAEARAVAPSVPIDASLLTGASAAQLLRCAEDASLLVVGNRGLGGFTGLLVGSVGITVAAHAPCPVVVVRGPGTPDGPVVVGVDGSPAAARAVTAAFAEAARRGAALIAVHAWTIPLRQEAGDGYAAFVAAGQRAGRELLEKSVAEVQPLFPDVPVELRLGDRSAAAELVDASHGAQLVVAGSRGVGSLRGLLLGSTAHALIHHADCPVLVHRG